MLLICTLEAACDISDEGYCTVLWPSHWASVPLVIATGGRVAAWLRAPRRHSKRKCMHLSSFHYEYHTVIYRHICIFETACDISDDDHCVIFWNYAMTFSAASGECKRLRGRLAEVTVKDLRKKYTSMLRVSVCEKTCNVVLFCLWLRKAIFYANVVKW